MDASSTSIEEPDWFECAWEHGCAAESRIEDGGGLGSSADWSRPGKSPDTFRDLRLLWNRRVRDWDLVTRLRTGFVKGGVGILSDQEIAMVREDAVKFLRSHGIDVSDRVSQGQPFALELLGGFLRIMGDTDQALPGLLEKGISTGVWDVIQPSGVFAPEDREQAAWTDMRSCDENWLSAEDNADRVEKLLEKEVAEGWVERWDGTWDQAVRRWGERAVCGKLALVTADGKEDRLIGDSSACGASPNARFPERVRHPRPQDVEAGIGVCKGLQQLDGEPWSAIVMDVAAAHKRLRLREADGGMSFFRCKGNLYRYKVAHFGAAWSAWWWSRVAAAIIRILHVFLCTGHLAYCYVDDFLVLVRKTEAEMVACLLRMLFAAWGSR